MAAGGSLRPGRLLSAYRNGIFPWGEEYEGFPVWYSPNPRWIILPEEIHVSRTSARLLRKGLYRFTFNTAFEEVMKSCASVPRPDQPTTWISRNFIEAYTRLHDMGHATSVEVWDAQDNLVGGLYGVDMHPFFFGESMFSRQAGTSKLALITLCRRMVSEKYIFLDCQAHTPHLESMGARPLARNLFLRLLSKHLKK